jgi:hypothetical protein
MANEFYEAEVGENISAKIPTGRLFFYKGRELSVDELPVQQAALKDIDLRNVELDILLPSGKLRTILLSASPLHNAEGQVRSSAGAFVDITEHKKAEENLTNIETDRKKEIHHRIKNNLQVISSLLDLQADQFRDREDIKDSEVLEAFRESQNRVIYMALSMKSCTKVNNLKH